MKRAYKSPNNSIEFMLAFGKHRTLNRLAMFNQLTKGEGKRVMYFENKHGFIDDYAAHIGWVTFAKTGKTVYYKDKVLNRLKKGGISGNHIDESTGEEYWVSGIKKRGTNAHWASSTSIKIDDDAKEEYEKIINS